MSNHGVAAYNNCGVRNGGEDRWNQGTMWQCVELAQRTFRQRLGYTGADHFPAGAAWEIWGIAATSQMPNTSKHPNKNGYAPVPADLAIHDHNSGYPYRHLAVADQDAPA